MTLSVRKLNLTAHITSSVSWMGAVATFLVLSIAGLIGRDIEVVRSVYISMNLIGQYVIIPLSFACLLTGILQSLITQWGLFKYYWVTTKFILTIIATGFLLLHQFTAVNIAAKRVTEITAGRLPDLGGLGPQLTFDASLALLTLIVATALSVYKPWGRGAKLGKITIIAVILMIVAFALFHLIGSGHHHRM